MSQFSSDLFNVDGDLAAEIGSESDETVFEAPIPPAGGAAGDAGPAGDVPPQRHNKIRSNYSVTIRAGRVRELN